MKEQERMINDIVKLNFEQAGRLSLCFNTPDARTVSAKEVKIIKNGKQVLHARQISDSANPKNNKTQIVSEKDGRKRKNRKCEIESCRSVARRRV
jgi:hypothetical protein